MTSDEDRIGISCLQLTPPGPGASAATHLAYILDEIRAAATAGADLIVLPELWDVGYFNFDLYSRTAEPESGPRASAVASVAAECGTYIHAGSTLTFDGAIRNTSQVFGPDGEVLGRYSKLHTFGFGSRERELIEAGEEATTARVLGMDVGMAICYDLRFPEHFRATVDEVSLYVVPAAWPASRIDVWSLLLRSRAIENQAFVVGCNGAGSCGGVALGGHSAIVDPWGTVLSEAGSDPGRLDATIDPEDARRARDRFPALTDRSWGPPSRRPTKELAR